MEEDLLNLNNGCPACTHTDDGLVYCRTCRDNALAVKVVVDQTCGGCDTCTDDMYCDTCLFKVAKLYTLSLLDQDQIDTFMDMLDRIYEGCEACAKDQHGVSSQGDSIMAYGVY